MPELNLLAHDVGPTGGMERVWWEILKRLPDRSVRLMTAGEPVAGPPASVASWRRLLAPARPVSVKLPWFYFSSGVTTAMAARVAPTVSMGAITAAPVDVAHVHFCHTGFQALGVPRQTGSYLRRANSAVVSKLSIAAERACYQRHRVRLLAAVSEGLAAELRTYFPGLTVRKVPNGIDLERFGPKPAVRSRLRDELGCGRDTVLALFVGGEWELKGLHIVLAALAGLPAGSGDVRLVVVGRGSIDRFRALARRAGVGERVTFVGQQSEIAPWYQAADLLVHPSLYETFSLVGHEAAASGLPIVATPVHGIRELIGDDEAGVVVERTAASVAAALARLADESELRARLGSAARRQSAGYTWERTTKAFLEVVDEARDLRERDTRT